MSDYRTNAGSKRRIVEDYYAAINAGRYEAYDEHCLEDFEDIATHGTTRGREAAKAASRAVHASFEGLAFTLDDVMEDGGKVAVRGRLRGTQVAPLFGAPSFGKSFEIGFLAIYELEGDRIARRWVNGDDAGMARQLGWAP